MVAPERVGEVISVIETVAQDWRPFDVAIDAGGGHLGRRGSVAWLAVDEGAGDVIALADDLHHGLPDGLIIGAPPKRTQSAHLTIARRVSDDLIGALSGSAHGPISARWTVDRLLLHRSLLSPRGSTYERLHEAALGG